MYQTSRDLATDIILHFQHAFADCSFPLPALAELYGTAVVVILSL